MKGDLDRELIEDHARVISTTKTHELSMFLFLKITLSFTKKFKNFLQ